MKSKPPADVKAHTIVGSWWIFAVIGLLLIAYGIYAFVLPTADPDHWFRNEIVDAADEATYIGGIFRLLGMMSAMVGFLTLAVAYFGFRIGSRNAWFGFLAYPVFFVLAIAFTWPGFAWSPLLVGSIIGLWNFYSVTNSEEK